MTETDDHLTHLDELGKKLQSEKKYIEALEVVEEALLLRKDRYGLNSEQVQATCKQLCEICNLLAMVYLQNENYNLSLELLKRAEMLASNNKQVKAITFNNFACYFRRMGKIRTSLQYLQKTLAIEDKLEYVENPADTHLNMCAVLSQLNKHSEAIEHSMRAIILLQDELLEKQLRQDSLDNFQDRYAVMAIALHNLGTEFEYLKRNAEALKAYKKASKFADLHLAPDHPFAENLRSVYNQASKKLAKSAPAGKKQLNRKSSSITDYLQKIDQRRGSPVKKSAGKLDNSHLITPRTGAPLETGIEETKAPQEPEVKPVEEPPQETLEEPEQKEEEVEEDEAPAQETSAPDPAPQETEEPPVEEANDPEQAEETPAAAEKEEQPKAEEEKQPKAEEEEPPQEADDAPAEDPAPVEEAPESTEVAPEADEKPAEQGEAEETPSE